MRYSITAIGFIFTMSGISGSLVAEPAVPTGCASDNTLNVCVTSSALNLFQRNDDGSEIVKVSIALQVTNKTNNPIQISYVNQNGQSTFMPRNAEGITDDYKSVAISGMNTCNGSLCKLTNDSGYFTTLAPGYPLRVQIVFEGRVTASAIRQIQAADTAAFSASLAVIEGGHQRFIPIPVPEFKFGNGLR